MVSDLVQADEATLRLCLRDVVALSSLPSMWRGLEPERIAESLAAALHTALSAEFVYVSLREPQGPALASVAQTSRHNTDPISRQNSRRRC